MAKENTEIKVEINGVPDLKSIPKAVLEPVIERKLHLFYQRCNSW